VRVSGDRVGARDGEQLAASFVEHHVQAKVRLQAPAEAALRAAHALGDRGDATAVRRVEMEDPIGLAVAQRAQDDGLGLDGARHQRAIRLSWS